MKYNNFVESQASAKQELANSAQFCNLLNRLNNNTDILLEEQVLSQIHDTLKEPQNL